MIEEHATDVLKACLKRALDERSAFLRNLTSTQELATRLTEENRELKATIESLAATLRAYRLPGLRPGNSVVVLAGSRIGEVGKVVEGGGDPYPVRFDDGRIVYYQRIELAPA